VKRCAAHESSGHDPDRPFRATAALTAGIDAQDAAAGAPPPGQREADGAQPPAEDQQAPKPVTRVRCAGCKAAIPVFSAQRPLVVTCPQCGRMGMLK